MAIKPSIFTSHEIGDEPNFKMLKIDGVEATKTTSGQGRTVCIGYKIMQPKGRPLEASKTLLILS